MKYSKIASVLIILGWPLILVLFFNLPTYHFTYGLPFSVFGWHLLLSFSLILFLLSIIFASIGKAKEKTLFAKIIFYISLVPLILLSLRYIFPSGWLFLEDNFPSNFWVIFSMW